MSAEEDIRTARLREDAANLNLIEVLTAKKGLRGLYLQALHFVPPEHVAEIVEECNRLNGDTTMFRGGKLGIITSVTPASMTQHERAWYGEAAVLFSKMARALGGQKNLEGPFEAQTEFWRSATDEGDRKMGVAGVLQNVAHSLEKLSRPMGIPSPGSPAVSDEIDPPNVA